MPTDLTPRVPEIQTTPVASRRAELVWRAGDPARYIACPGDVVLTRGGRWLSRAIRTMTRSAGEGETLVNHVGILVSGSPDWGGARIVEALGRGVELRVLGRGYRLAEGGVAIYRYTGMYDDQRAEIVRAAVEYALSTVGQRYGYAKLLLHMADWGLGRAIAAPLRAVGLNGPRDIEVFRRLGVNRWPICSHVVANAYSALVPEFWPMDPDHMTPDDIHDFVSNSADWELVRRLRETRE